MSSRMPSSRGPPYPFGFQSGSGGMVVRYSTASPHLYLGKVPISEAGALTVDPVAFLSSSMEHDAIGRSVGWPRDFYLLLPCIYPR